MSVAEAGVKIVKGMCILDESKGRYEYYFWTFKLSQFAISCAFFFLNIYFLFFILMCFLFNKIFLYHKIDIDLIFHASIIIIHFQNLDLLNCFLKIEEKNFLRNLGIVGPYKGSGWSVRKMSPHGIKQWFIHTNRWRKEEEFGNNEQIWQNRSTNKSETILFIISIHIINAYFLLAFVVGTEVFVFKQPLKAEPQYHLKGTYLACSQSHFNPWHPLWCPKNH